jgi:thiol:disulfide interchange protein
MTQKRWVNIIWVAIIIVGALWYFYSDWINSHANPIILVLLLLVLLLLATFYVVHDLNVEVDETKAKTLDEKLDNILEKLSDIDDKVK